MNKKSLYSSKPFDKSLLPTNRKELFRDILHLHYFSLMKLGLILFAFLLPLLALGLIKDYSYILAADSGESNFATLIISDIMELPFVLLLSVFVSGAARILREYAWMEPVFFREDFKTGVKENLKPILLSALFIAVLNLVFEYIRTAFTSNGFIAAIPFGLNVFVFYPVFLHVILISSLYTNKYGKNFKLGCFFYLKHLPSTIGLMVLLLLPKAADLFHFANILTLFIKYVTFLVIIIFITPMILMAIVVNEMRVFDIHVNSVRFPELVDKGLYRPDFTDLNSKNDSK